LEPAEIWHSTLLRAEQTAVGLAEGAEWKIHARRVRGISRPDENPRSSPGSWSLRGTLGQSWATIRI